MNTRPNYNNNNNNNNNNDYYDYYFNYTNTNPHIQVLIMSFVSSTDNFLVGLARGLGDGTTTTTSTSSTTTTVTTSTTRTTKNKSNRTNRLLRLFQLSNILYDPMIYIVSFCNASGSYMATIMGTSIDYYSQIIIQHLLHYNFSSTSTTTTTTTTIIRSDCIHYILSGVAFLYLSYNEYRSNNNKNDTTKSSPTPILSNNVCRNEKDDDNDTNNNNTNPVATTTTTGFSSSSSRTTTITILRDALVLALPMTLNNIAGGIVTGLATGIEPYIAFVYNLISSFVAMLLGYIIGSKTKLLQKQSKVMSLSRSSLLSSLLSLSSTDWSTYLYLFLAFQSFYNAYSIPTP